MDVLNIYISVFKILKFIQLYDVSFKYTIIHKIGECCLIYKKNYTLINCSIDS